MGGAAHSGWVDVQELPVVFSLPSMTGVFIKNSLYRVEGAGAQDSGAWERVTATEADRYGLLSAYKRMCRVAAARTGSQGRRGAGLAARAHQPMAHAWGSGEGKREFPEFPAQL